MKHEPLHRGIKQGMLLSLLCFFFSVTYAQNNIPPEVTKKLQAAYNSIKKPEIPFKRFAEINAHVFMKNTAGANKTAAALAPQDPYCNNVRALCTNGDFESGLDQNQWTGAYGFTTSEGLYPNPFNYTFGFSSGDLFDGAAHQTIVDNDDGTDFYTGISLTPANGGDKALRLGNAQAGAGFEILAKTFKVSADETILNFYYAVVLEDPGHFREDQPAFSVRVYDCATGNELPNVCDLGNGDNIAVSDASNPFFQDTVSGFSLIAYRDWSLAQIDLSKHIGKTVIVVFTNKDCNPTAHFGYTYLDNIFSSKCPPEPPTDPDLVLDSLNTDTCGIGKICAKYQLPTKDSSGITVTGTVKLTLDIYQNSSLTKIKTLTSPTLKTGSSYCFNIDPNALGVNTSLGGFDYVITGKFVLGTFTLPAVIIGNPPTGQQSGANNDYKISCDTTLPVYYSKATGNLHDVATWGKNPDGSGDNPPDFGSGNTFNLANRSGVYTMTGNWTVGGTLFRPAGSQLQINGHTLSVASLTGTGTFTGTNTSNLIIAGTVGDGAGIGTLHFSTGGGLLNNFTINRNGSGASATLGSPLSIYTGLFISKGKLNTGGLLTLKSSATNTAHVAQVTGTISGNVTVERYITARRAWRLLNAPVGGTQTIKAAWQEGAANASSNPNPGFGTHITGGPKYGSAANGFDVNTSPLRKSYSSLKFYNNATGGWDSVSNTNTTTVGNKPYMLFVRGDRSIPLSGPDVPANSTVLRSSGPLKVGNQTFSVNANGFTAVPNPFASPINFQTITKTNVMNKFWVWDPKVTGATNVGGFVSVSWNGSSYDVTPAPVSAISQYIQSGQAFMVQSTGSAGSLVIKETDKSATAAADVFASASRNREAGRGLKLNLFTEEGSEVLLDGIFLSYSSRFSDNVDGMDVSKLANLDENLAIVREGQLLMVDRRTVANANDAIQLKLWNTTQRSYTFEVEPINLSATGLHVYLKDNYLHTTTPLDRERVSRIGFSITADAASASPDRFALVMATKELQEESTIPDGITVFPNPMKGRTISLRLTNQPQGTYRVTLVNALGQVVQQENLNHSGGSALHTIGLRSKPAKGIYQLNVVKGEAKTILKLLSE
jgi:hypothetical protein